MTRKTSMDNLDFDDISGKKVSAPKEPKKPKKPSKKTNIVLSIPTNQPRTWIDKDLTDCTGEEFVLWASRVYPVNLKEEAELLDKEPMRLKAFKKILYYHTHSPFQRGKKDTENTTVN